MVYFDVEKIKEIQSNLRGRFFNIKRNGIFHKTLNSCLMFIKGQPEMEFIIHKEHLALTEDQFKDYVELVNKILRYYGYVYIYQETKNEYYLRSINTPNTLNNYFVLMMFRAFTYPDHIFFPYLALEIHYRNLADPLEIIKFLSNISHDNYFFFANYRGYASEFPKIIKNGKLVDETEIIRLKIRYDFVEPRTGYDSFLERFTEITPISIRKNENKIDEIIKNYDNLKDYIKEISSPKLKIDNIYYQYRGRTYPVIERDFNYYYKTKTKLKEIKDIYKIKIEVSDI